MSTRATIATPMEEKISGLKKAQIGRCGELLVQLRLLLKGVESAPLTTDSGIDLVAYSPQMTCPVTIQVKANERAKPGGGKGSPALDWWIPDSCPADLVALVDLASLNVWVFTMSQIRSCSQQHPGVQHHLYMYLNPNAKPRIDGQISRIHEFDPYLLEKRTHAIFGVAESASASNTV